MVYRLALVAAGAALSGQLAGVAARLPVEVLESVDALPAHLVNRLRDQTAVVRTASGEHLLLDRRDHGVFRIDTARRDLVRVLDVGYEPGHVLRPSTLALGADDIFAVLDAPNDLQRIQYFDVSGRLIGGFFLPIVGTPQMIIGDVVVSGVGAMAFTGRSFLVAEPAWGSLVAELDTAGDVVRHIGDLRPTGHESDRAVHLALNTGLPIVDPTGGYIFVFQTGVPLFRRYSARGALVFERHIEGPELDALVLGLPTTWERDENRRPIVPPLVRTAAVDDRGQLWVSLASGFTYVYDEEGEKIRVVQFRGASVLAPSHLSFRRGGRLLVTPGGYEFETR